MSTSRLSSQTVKWKAAYFAQLAPRPGISVWEKNKKVRSEKTNKHIYQKQEKQVTGSPQLQSWHSQLEQGYDHVQFERTHPHPVDTDTVASKSNTHTHRHTHVEAVHVCLFGCEGIRWCTLWPSFLISSTAWLSRLKRFFLALCLPGG